MCEGERLKRMKREKEEKEKRGKKQTTRKKDVLVTADHSICQHVRAGVLSSDLPSPHSAGIWLYDALAHLSVIKVLQEEMFSQLFFLSQSQIPSPAPA